LYVHAFGHVAVGVNERVSSGSLTGDLVASCNGGESEGGSEDVEEGRQMHLESLEQLRRWFELWVGDLGASIRYASRPVYYTLAEFNLIMT